MPDGLKARVNVHGKITPDVRAQQKSRKEIWEEWHGMMFNDKGEVVGPDYPNPASFMEAR
jgi:hypothetical protein